MTHLGHKAEVQDTDLAFRGADEVAGVGVSMQESCLQQLDQVTVKQGGAQLPYIPSCALAQFLAYTQHMYLPDVCTDGHFFEEDIGGR